MLPLAPPLSAAVFLLVVAPVCGWVILTDLREMKIRNTAILTLLALFACLGPVLLPWPEMLARVLRGGTVLLIGIALHLIARFGAGDVKFAAAATVFLPPDPASTERVLLLLPAFTLGALVAHRLARRLPAVRALAPHWVSWQRADFPFGLALAGTLLAALAAEVALPPGPG